MKEKDLVQPVKCHECGNKMIRHNGKVFCCNNNCSYSFENLLILERLKKNKFSEALEIIVDEFRNNQAVDSVYHTWFCVLSYIIQDNFEGATNKNSDIVAEKFLKFLIGE